MKTPALLFLVASSLVVNVPSLRAQTTIPNPMIDYAGFQKIVDSSEKERESRRLTEDAFLQMMQANGTVVLDARSSAMYKLRHVTGGDQPAVHRFQRGFPGRRHPGEGDENPHLL